MNTREYFNAKRYLIRRKEIVKKEIVKMIESAIAIYGHSWCMDVAVERKKMAKLLIAQLRNLA